MWLISTKLTLEQILLMAWMNVVYRTGIVTSRSKAGSSQALLSRFENSRPSQASRRSELRTSV